ncbi:MAG: S-layer homology domain-containing protein [Clostridia bacterium]|nr:S-layer homology domain-containing protein [Clostridia bacterium]
MKRIISVFLSLIVVFGISAEAVENYSQKVDNLTLTVGSFLFETVKEAVPNSIGGEWSVVGLSRSDVDIPEKYFETYYKTAEKYVKDKNGVLSKNKYTEYSRVVIALCSIGKNPENVSGYNLIAPLLDYDKVIKQGLNGPVWALIALDAAEYNDDEIRTKYIDLILSRQLPSGGWALNSSVQEADVDITAMVLTALSSYMDKVKVKTAVDKGLSYLSGIQNIDGSFGEYSESTSQVIVALSSLGISQKDSRFFKNGKTAVDALMNFHIKGKGFKHAKSDKESNLMSTEQGFYALVSLKRFEDGKSKLFDMSDGISISGNNAGGNRIGIKYPNKTFSDIKNHKYKSEIEALCQRGIINGMTENTFSPDFTMTRAEFATITVRVLGLEAKGIDVFSDVKKTDWYYGFVGTAYDYSIIKGVSENRFNPNGTITREEAAVMVKRSAKICGIDKTYNESAVRNVLSQFTDYKTVSTWAKEGLAFCYDKGILDDSEIEINPKEAVKRGEIAYMLYNLLKEANRT